MVPSNDRVSRSLGREDSANPCAGPLAELSALPRFNTSARTRPIFGDVCSSCEHDSIVSHQSRTALTVSVNPCLNASARSFDSKPLTAPSLRKYRSALPSRSTSPSYARISSSSSDVGKKRIIDWTASASRTLSSMVCTAPAISSSEALICESMISMLLPRFRSSSVMNAFLPLPDV